MSSTNNHYGINDARPILGDLVTAVEQGAEIVLTRRGRPAARLIAFKEPVMLATVATAGSITDQHRISVDETRDGLVISTPFVRELTTEDIESGEWDVILADAGWTVTTGWDDHGGYWTAEVEPGTSYTIEIQESADGQAWQALAPAETVTDGESAEQVAQDVAVNQNVADGGLWRVCIWRGADADTGTEPAYTLDGESPERANDFGVIQSEERA
nr:type II toxin-antitoxin system Phd/YefM family antitoxin [Micromonospora sp. DSM 115978]